MQRFGAEAAHFAGLDVEARVVDQARAVDGDAAAIETLGDGGGALDVAAEDGGAQRVRRPVRQGDGLPLVAGRDQADDRAERAFAEDRVGRRDIR